MIELLVSIFAFVAAASAAYTLSVIDSIVQSRLYDFGLEFSPDWAGPYWMALRIGMVLLGLIAAVASTNITLFFWKRFKRRKMVKPIGQPQRIEQPKMEEPKTIEPKPIEQPRMEEPQIADGRVASLFQCTSCGRSITHPLRMLDFHSRRPRMVNICPFCNATVVPIGFSSAKKEEGVSEERLRKDIRKAFS